MVLRHKNDEESTTNFRKEGDLWNFLVGCVAPKLFQSSGTIAHVTAGIQVLSLGPEMKYYEFSPFSYNT